MPVHDKIVKMPFVLKRNGRLALIVFAGAAEKKIA
jgi:hypothetical protein